MILDVVVKQKRHFDINNKKDIELYRNFMITRSWGKEGCPFTLEFPHLTIPDMIKNKLLHKYMKIEQEQNVSMV